MVSTKSQMLKLGTKAPEFSLKNSINDHMISFEENKGNNGTLVFFICNHCPFVIHVRDQFKPLYEEYSAKGISFIAINSNSTETHPQDGPEHMKTLVLEMQWDFPYLFDETQEVAMAYNAACTPDFFLFDKELKLYYRGQLDSSRPKTNTSPEDQKPSMGCNIKWKPGNEPQYFTDSII
jgi:peroxiredoxin